MFRENIRNVAIIAHVDHGKTTLVDQMLKQGGIFRDNQVVKDRVMDSNAIERERGITILSKNTSVNYKDYKINIVDTPGHQDFGGEVERVLKMVNGVVLLVDAFEGPMPQTKFVLKKAIELNLPVVCAINKIDRKEARPMEVADEVIDLFIELGADEEYLETPFIYTSAKGGFAVKNPEDAPCDMSLLFDTILEKIPPSEGDKDAPLQVLISTIDYNDYLGRIGIGKIETGTIKKGEEIALLNYNEEGERILKINNLYVFHGLERVEVGEAYFGEIIAISGISDINVGDTISDKASPKALPFVKISEPTIAVYFSVNNSPFAGREGKYITSRNIRERLYKELETDVSLKVEDTTSTDTFKVSGRGELHLTVLMENLRRENYEFQVSKPEVLYKEIDGKIYEPIEICTIDALDVGIIIERLGERKGELIEMKEPKGGYTRLVFKIPSRGLIGYRGIFISDTKGEGIMNTEFLAYEPYKGDIPKRRTGSLISFETGVSTSYGLKQAEERGILFIQPGIEVYQGMVIGENPKGLDIEVNVCRKKQQTNIRAAGSDEQIKLSPPNVMTLEEALEFIEDDELIEITPKCFRLRKKILDKHKRAKVKKLDL